MTVEFDTNVHSLNLVMSTLFKRLRDLNDSRNLGKVAILTESDTELGNRSTQLVQAPKWPGGAGITEMKFAPYSRAYAWHSFIPAIFAMA